VSTYRSAIRELLAGRDLSREAAHELALLLLGGELDTIQTAALLTALTAKGACVQELCGMAEGMRSHMLPVQLDEALRARLVDTCGTGGSGLDTFNTSTVAAFVTAAAGVPTAKHGNRAGSGKCGSMDLLEALGVVFDTPPEVAAQLLEKHDLCFMFARRHHPAMRHVAPVRRSLGFRTVFNFLGPLCNPAGVTKQVLGVSDAAQAPRMLEVLRSLGSERVLIVHGADGLDEISLSAPTQTWELRDGELRKGRIEPGDFGLSAIAFERLAGGDVERNRQLFMGVIGGDLDEPRSHHVAVNAGAALYLAESASSLVEGYRMALELLKKGRVSEHFLAYRQASMELAGRSSTPTMASDEARA